MVWYSGWYNGLAKKHFFHPSRGVRLEHEVIVHCKANPDIRVIDAIAIVLKDERVLPWHRDEMTQVGAAADRVMASPITGAVREYVYDRTIAWNGWTGP